MFGHETHLACRWARGIDDKMRIDERLVRPCGAHALGCVVGADDANEDALGTERGDIARHIAGATHDDLAAARGDHRRRRFRRDARDFAIDEFVKHQIADAEHGLARDFEKFLVGVEHDSTGTGPRRRDSAHSREPHLRAR
jgi:hypothetical protein